MAVDYTFTQSRPTPHLLVGSLVCIQQPQPSIMRAKFMYYNIVTSKDVKIAHYTEFCIFSGLVPFAITKPIYRFWPQKPSRFENFAQFTSWFLTSVLCSGVGRGLSVHSVHKQTRMAQKLRDWLPVPISYDLHSVSARYINHGKNFSI